jgi:hypothetical protein
MAVAVVVAVAQQLVALATAVLVARVALDSFSCTIKIERNK